MKKSTKKHKKAAKYNQKPIVNAYEPIKRHTDTALNNMLQRHISALLASLVRLLKAPFASGLAIIVMAIAIALAGSFYVLVNNAQQLVSTLQTGSQISLFMQQKVSDQQAARLVQELKTHASIAEVVLITKQQALEEFQQYSGFGAALDALSGNPLPAVLQIAPKQTINDATQLGLLLQQLESQPAVEFAQMDMDWVARLQALMQMVSRVVLLLSVLFALAVVFITGNTVRTELQARRDEVIVTKLVGGTNAFIRLPFLYAGFWYGFIAACIAWCIITFMLWLVQAPIAQLSQLYQSQFQLNFLSFSETVLLVFIAAILGVVGAFAVASHQLSLLKPE
ncbi:MAG: FtsX-like permease family protein [Methyloprofundus sp.]|nr:FtsX-like permease family protein [Methyloprofundus sp.]